MHREQHGHLVKAATNCRRRRVYRLIFIVYGRSRRGQEHKQGYMKVHAHS
jgi:hypothetical protein